MLKQSNLLKQFQTWMEQKGYKKTTQSNHPSTIADYSSSLMRICAWEGMTLEQVKDSITSIHQQYTIGIHSCRGKMKSRAIRSAISAFSRFLLETQVA
jgi:hypothetical protein